MRNLKTMLTNDVFGRKVIRLDRKTDVLEICKTGGKWQIMVEKPFIRTDAWIIDGTEFPFNPVPEFPNMMQAYRFLKENWMDIY